MSAVPRSLNLKSTEITAHRLVFIATKHEQRVTTEMIHNMKSALEKVMKAFKVSHYDTKYC